MSQIKQKTIEKQLGSAKLIRKFLDFINAQENSYYIIKDAGIYSLFEEAVPKLDKAYPKGGPSLEDAIEKFLVLSFCKFNQGQAHGHMLEEIILKISFFQMRVVINLIQKQKMLSMV